MTESLIRSPSPGTAEFRRCPGCGELQYTRRLERNQQVCPDCGLHLPLTAAERIGTLLDTDSVEELTEPTLTVDPLGFVDSVPYPERVAAARRRTGLREAVVCVRGTIRGAPVIAAVMDFRFLGGSLGSAVGDLITRAADTALREATPLLIVTASGGARMQEGALALMQMAKTSQALAELDEAGIMTISLVTDPTFGGVAASFATLCDVIICEPRARLGFAGRRVVEQTIRQQLPEEFQTAEFLLERGLIDMIRTRRQLRATIGRLLDVGSRADGPDEADPVLVELYGMDEPVPDAAPLLVTDPAELPERDAWQMVRHARELDRPTTAEYIANLVTGFEELRGDRVGGDCPAVIAGLGRFDGIPVAVMGHQKGHSAAELTRHNFGMPAPAGYRKSARVMRLAAKLGLPVVTLVDTPGAYPGASAEEQGQSVAIAENLRLMARLPVPTVAVVTGEGGSGGALALAVADRVLICGGGTLSVISPEGCAAILWKNAAAAPVAAASLRVDARQLLTLGVVDAVVPEPDGGAHTDPAEMMRRVGAAAARSLRELISEDPACRAARRRARLRDAGVPSAGTGPAR